MRWWYLNSSWASWNSTTEIKNYLWDLQPEHLDKNKWLANRYKILDESEFAAFIEKTKKDIRMNVTSHANNLTSSAAVKIDRVKEMLSSFIDNKE